MHTENSHTLLFEDQGPEKRAGKRESVLTDHCIVELRSLAIGQKGRRREEE